MKRIIVCTPYFNNIGGTELEALNSAIFLSKKNIQDKVYIFTPKNEIHPFFLNETIKHNINLFSYPPFFYFNFLKRIKFFNEYIFWLLKSLHSKSTFYILGYIPATYFFPILSIKKSKKILKVTMNHFVNIPKNQKYFYNKLDKIIVFNVNQRKYWQEVQGLSTKIINLDITISMEQDLLNIFSLKKTNCFVLGYLGRVSEEKNIEDMIELVYQLKLRKIHVKLIIQGKSNSVDYSRKLLSLIQEYNLKNNVVLNDFFIEPNQVCHFYSSIDIFLVTSTSEGGPITALEALAAGRIVISYDIGAMKERLEKFPICIVNNLDELIISVIAVINMDNKEFIEFTNNLRCHYIKHLANNKKIEVLNNLIYS